MATILDYYFRFWFRSNFCHWPVILHQPAKFHQNLTTLDGVMMSYPLFKMAAVSHIGFDLGNVRPPTKCNCWSKLDPQIWSWSDFYVWYGIAIFGVLAWNCLFPALDGSGGVFPPSVVTHRSNPQKAPLCVETHRLSHKAWKSVQRFDLGTGSRKKLTIGQYNISLFREKPPLHQLNSKFV